MSSNLMNVSTDNFLVIIILLLPTLYIVFFCYRLVISQNGNALHIVFPYQFLDSPEWFGVSTDEFFQVIY